MDLIQGLAVGEKTPRIEEKEEMKDTEVTEKIEEVKEEKIGGRTMVTPEPKGSTMGEEVMATTGREGAHEESARRLQAKGSLL